MSFKKIVVEGKGYGNIEDISEETIKRQYPSVQQVSFRDSSFFNRLHDDKIQTALRIMYLCHDIFVDKKTEGETA